jgi:hypothetical protein
MEWKANGNAIKLLIPNLAATGRDPNAAAIEATSKCHPKYGAIKYDAPKTYTPTPHINSRTPKQKNDFGTYHPRGLLRSFDGGY